MSSNPLRAFARGKPCLVRLTGICNWDDSTTVLAHIRRANVAGMGQKPPDTCAVWACSSCHDEIDRRTRNNRLKDIEGDLLDALIRQHAWYDKHEILIVTISGGTATGANPPPALMGSQSLHPTEVEMT